MKPAVAEQRAQRRAIMAAGARAARVQHWQMLEWPERTSMRIFFVRRQIRTILLCIFACSPRRPARHRHPRSRWGGGGGGRGRHALYRVRGNRLGNMPTARYSQTLPPLSQRASELLFSDSGPCLTCLFAFAFVFSGLFWGLSSPSALRDSPLLGLLLSRAVRAFATAMHWRNSLHFHLS